MWPFFFQTKSGNNVWWPEATTDSCCQQATRYMSHWGAIFVARGYHSYLDLNTTIFLRHVCRLGLRTSSREYNWLPFYSPCYHSVHELAVRRERWLKNSLWHLVLIIKWRPPATNMPPLWPKVSCGFRPQGTFVTSSCKLYVPGLQRENYGQIGAMPQLRGSSNAECYFIAK